MKKKIFSIIIIFVLGILMMTNIYAISSINANLTSSVTEVREEQNFTITLKFDNYKEISKNGIHSYKATLEYDENIFEEVDANDFVGLNDWGEIYYNKETKEFIAIKKAGSKQAEEVMQINLKVKEDATPGITTIEVKDIVYSEGKTDIEVNNISKKVEVVKTQTDETNASGTTTNPSEPTTPNDSDVSNPEKPGNSDTSNTEKPTDSNVSDSEKPGNSDISNTEKPTDSDVSNSEKPGNSDTSNIDKSTGLDISNTSKPSGSDVSSNTDKLNSSDTSSNPASLSKIDPEIYQGTIPKTGKNYAIVFCLIVVEIIFATVSFIKYKKIDEKIKSKVNKKKKGFVISFCAVIISIQLFGSVYTAFSAFALKGALNDDDVIDYADANLLEKHLIHLESLPEEKLENADMNSDGYLTVTDLSLLVQKIEDLLEYEVNLSNIKVDKAYPEKNEEIILSFTADVSYNK
jgi:hypothetical protein